ncbi:OLC1v1012548C1 [Oldenlandia corymbosa var. corymbosa]|uniref:OLC1v1012548C1 n=1 Tax=Oldenlandia corymbosa var. corymbosa TaxID=529605 RepID=A0AAV1DYC1_OLDCO|nr:OLC1v1012548C1 [Oldenlandia corymbosa var. corymbosa]
MGRIIMCVINDPHKPWVNWVTVLKGGTRNFIVKLLMKVDTNNILKLCHYGLNSRIVRVLTGSGKVVTLGFDLATLLVLEDQSCGWVARILTIKIFLPDFQVDILWMECFQILTLSSGNLQGTKSKLWNAILYLSCTLVVKMRLKEGMINFPKFGHCVLPLVMVGVVTGGCRDINLVFHLSRAVENKFGVDIFALEGEFHSDVLYTNKGISNNWEANLALLLLIVDISLEDKTGFMEMGLFEFASVNGLGRKFFRILGTLRLFMNIWMSLMECNIKGWWTAFLKFTVLLFVPPDFAYTSDVWSHNARP